MESVMFDLHYVAQVMAELLSRQYGREIQTTLIPKDLQDHLEHRDDST